MKKLHGHSLNLSTPAERDLQKRLAAEDFHRILCQDTDQLPRRSWLHGSPQSARIWRLTDLSRGMDKV